MWAGLYPPGASEKTEGKTLSEVSKIIKVARIMKFMYMNGREWLALPFWCVALAFVWLATKIEKSR